MPRDQIIYTNEAKCQDCYRCVRVCPVKAITMKQGQAQVDSDKCIVCGTCIRECPQNAKTYRRDVEQVKKIVSQYENVYAVIAPAYLSISEDWERKRFPSILRKLGFLKVYEAAESAYAVAEKTCEYVEKNVHSNCLTTSCPVFVSYIEKYESEFVTNLIPVVSPMIAIAKKIKFINEDAKLVFIGPCIGKKYEIQRSEFAGLVDNVLTFQELNEWIEEEKIDIKQLEESNFNKIDINKADLFPLVGGLIKTSSGKHIIPEENILAVSGVKDIRESLASLKENNNISFVEPLFCENGCINGPGIISDKSVFYRKYQLEKIYNSKKSDNLINKEDDSYLSLDLATRFSQNNAINVHKYSDEEIRKVLEKTGRADKEDQLNCGACGYNTCREKAVAVLSGMAEIEMCMPYTIRLAKQRTDKIIESSPNGIVIVDDQLCIIHMNAAFRRFFMCTNSILGKRISYLMDPELFIKLRDGDEEKVEQTIRHENYNLICHQILYKLPNENQYAGIFVNITKSIADSNKLDDLKQQTIFQAQELLNHQIDMAQKIAKYLGESAAKGEELVENIMKLADDEKEQKSRKNKNWLWNIYTSK